MASIKIIIHDFNFRIFSATPKRKQIFYIIPHLTAYAKQYAETVLNTISECGITQIVLSASEMSNLSSQMGEFDLADYFDEILGLSDIYAKSKIDLGLNYISRNKVEKALLIGDTTHDCEVAKSLGADCVLIPNGHQSRETLLTCGVPVLDDISCVLGYIN